MRMGGKCADYRSPSDKGAAAELAVTLEYLANGYSIYRSVSSVGPFDLLAYKDGEVLRIEVKSLTFGEGGKPSFGYPRHDEYDVLALVDLAVKPARVFYEFRGFDMPTLRGRLASAA